MSHPLDDPAILALDRSDMFGRIREMGTELIRAWDLFADLDLPAGARGAANIVVAGMGGSATAGDYFAALCHDSSEIPVHVVRGARLPNYVSESSLVVVASYSGNTDEAMACYARVLALQPAHQDALYNLGNCEIHAGNLARALEHFCQAVQVNPEFEGFHSRR